MPELWKRMARHVADSEEAKGVDPKTAERIGYATATKSWEAHHGGETPQQSAGESPKRKKSMKMGFRRKK